MTLLCPQYHKHPKQRSTSVKRLSRLGPGANGHRVFATTEDSCTYRDVFTSF